MKEKTKNYQNGVIIGRFQVDELHESHITLIDEVISRHNRVIIFLGVSSVLGTKNNPLDFITRKKMIENIYSDEISAILPLHDCKSDVVWSKQVDSKIKEVFPLGSTVLYGSRDSFIPHYFGVNNTCELEPENNISGTDIRKRVSERVLSTQDFRAGVIYGVSNTYPTVYSTVDVAILNDDSTKVLLGRKPLEDKFRFVGGFVDVTDNTIEAAAIREAQEETGCVIGDLNYLGSTKVNDWRYRGDNHRSVMTHFYSAKRLNGVVKAQDDIAEVSWYNVTDLKDGDLVSEHNRLLELLKKSLNK